MKILKFRVKHLKKSSNTPLAVYHGVPSGWDKEDIVQTYHELNGARRFNPPEATEPGAPSWMVDRYNWLQYRSALREIAKGLKAKDPVCVELAIRYIELDYFGSYSGFLRERFARLLKNSKLTFQQARRLKRHIQFLRDNNQMLGEFREYAKLIKRIQEVWPNA
jgi:hypothetical protein